MLVEKIVIFLKGIGCGMRAIRFTNLKIVCVLDGGFRCSENGRPDSFYTKWRWQPKDCNLPRFDAKMMVEKLRDKRLVFAGDSIGRNQWESLLCMLSSAIPNKSSIYEVNGRPMTKHSGSLIEYYRAPFKFRDQMEVRAVERGGRGGFQHGALVEL